MLNTFLFGYSHIWIPSTNLKVKTRKTNLSLSGFGVMQIDGKQTLNENIADNGGIKLAYEVSHHLSNLFSDFSKLK